VAQSPRLGCTQVDRKARNSLILLMLDFVGCGEVALKPLTFLPIADVDMVGVTGSIPVAPTI